MNKHEDSRRGGNGRKVGEERRGRERMISKEKDGIKLPGRREAGDETRTNWFAEKEKTFYTRAKHPF